MKTKIEQPYCALVGRFIFLRSIYSFNTMTTTPQKSYSQFNALSVSGRIFNAEIPEGQDFLAVTVISTLQNDGQEVTFTFNSSNGLKSLYEKGWLPTGRSVTVTGHIAKVSETYFDKKSGQTLMRKRPEIHLVGVQILDGGLGPMPEGKTPAVNTAGTVVGAPVKATV